MNQALTSESGTEAPAENTPPQTFSTPPVDVYESDQEFLVYADLPGVAKDGVALRFEDERLFIEGRTRDGQHVLRRSFGVRDQIEADRIEAKLEDGVLEVHLPKSERARPREIQVS